MRSCRYTHCTFKQLQRTCFATHNSPSLTISQAGLTGSIANPTKIYVQQTPRRLHYCDTDWAPLTEPLPHGMAIHLLTIRIRLQQRLIPILEMPVKCWKLSFTSATFGLLTGTSAGNYTAPTWTGSNQSDNRSKKPDSQRYSCK